MESRKIEFDINKTLEIVQDLKYGYAGEVWDAALVFCNSAKTENFQKFFPLKNKTIIELGSGTGICGIFLSALEPERVILTDKSEALPLINENIELNKNTFICPKTEILVEEFLWNDKEKTDYYKKKYKFDYILCSDIIYDKNNYEDLEEIFNSLAVENHTVILFSFTYREETGIGFFDFFKKSPDWKLFKLPDQLIHEDFRCDDIFMLYAKKTK